MNKIITTWNHFWFEHSNPMALSLMRIVLGCSMLLMYIPRQFQMDIYAADAIIGFKDYRNIFDDFFRPPIDWHFWPDSLNLAAHSLFLLLLMLFVLGVLSRPLTVLLWVLHIGFIHRNISIVFGADFTSALFLFYLMWTRHSQYFSVLTFFGKKTNSNKTDILSSIMIRFLQIQLSVIYAYTGIEKLKGATWWDGTALWQVLVNPQITTFNFEFLRHLSLLLIVVSFLTIIFEIYFPVMVINRWSRYPWLVMGAFFHVGIAVMLGLVSFSGVMLSAYFLFLSLPEDLPKFLKRGFLKT